MASLMIDRENLTCHISLPEAGSATDHEMIMQLIPQAGKGFLSLLTQFEKVQQFKNAIVTLNGSAPEAIIRDLVRELVLYYNEDKLIFSGFEFIETGDESFMVSMLGERVNPQIHRITHETLIPPEATEISMTHSEKSGVNLTFSVKSD